VDLETCLEIKIILRDRRVPEIEAFAARDPNLLESRRHQAKSIGQSAERFAPRGRRALRARLVAGQRPAHPFFHW